jgi:hypothetical protein
MGIAVYEDWDKAHHGGGDSKCQSAFKDTAGQFEGDLDKELTYRQSGWELDTQHVCDKWYLGPSTFKQYVCYIS